MRTDQKVEQKQTQKQNGWRRAKNLMATTHKKNQNWQQRTLDPKLRKQWTNLQNFDSILSYLLGYINFIIGHLG